MKNFGYIKMEIYYNFNILDIQFNCKIIAISINMQITIVVEMNIILNNEIIDITPNMIYYGDNDIIYNHVYSQLRFLRDFNIISGFGTIKRLIPVDRTFIEKKIFNIFKNNKYNKNLHSLHTKIMKIYKNKKYFTTIKYKSKLYWYCGFIASDDYSYGLTPKSIHRISPDFSETTEIEFGKLFKKICDGGEILNIINSEKDTCVISGSGEIYKIKNIKLSEDTKSIIIQFDKCSIDVNLSEFK